MERNLYVYTLNSEGELTKSHLSNVCVTRTSPRKIVEKRSKNYKLQMGNYYLHDELEKIIGEFKLKVHSLRLDPDFPLALEGRLTYITFQEDIPELIKQEMLGKYKSAILNLKQMYLDQLDVIDRKLVKLNE